MKQFDVEFWRRLVRATGSLRDSETAIYFASVAEIATVDLLCKDQVTASLFVIIRHSVMNFSSPQFTPDLRSHNP
jgi:hypothetical protein